MEDTTMKKTYINPSLAVVKLETQGAMAVGTIQTTLNNNYSNAIDPSSGDAREGEVTSGSVWGEEE